MRGAPELEPDDIGNVQKFNEFLKRHANYAAQAREQNCTWSSVAGLLARYSEDLAIAFSAVALKRGDQRTFDAQTVLNLSDDVFEKLYVEACCPSVEYPSQVINQLETTAFIRQTEKESSPLPAVMRAAEAFRVQLRLLPTHAVAQCTQDAVRNAWFQLLFGDEAPRKRLDFQTCITWEQARTALIQRATTNSAWFGDSLRSTPGNLKLPSVPTTASESSVTSNGSTVKPVKNVSYYERRIEQLKKEGALDSMSLDGLTPKQIYKLGTKERHKAKIAAETAAKDADAKKFQESLVKQQQDFQANMQRQLTQQQGTLLSALSKAQQPVRDQSPRDHYRSHSAEGRRNDGYSDNRRNFNDGQNDGRRQHTPERRCPQDSGSQAPPSDRRGQSPRPPSTSDQAARSNPATQSGRSNGK